MKRPSTAMTKSILLGIGWILVITTPMNFVLPTLQSHDWKLAPPRGSLPAPNAFSTEEVKEALKQTIAALGEEINRRPNLKAPLGEVVNQFKKIISTTEELSNLTRQLSIELEEKKSNNQKEVAIQGVLDRLGILQPRRVASLFRKNLEQTQLGPAVPEVLRRAVISFNHEFVSEEYGIGGIIKHGLLVKGSVFGRGPIKDHYVFVFPTERMRQWLECGVMAHFIAKDLIEIDRIPGNSVFIKKMFIPITGADDGLLLHRIVSVKVDGETYLLGFTPYDRVMLSKRGIAHVTEARLNPDAWLNSIDVDRGIKEITSGLMKINWLGKLSLASLRGAVSSKESYQASLFQFHNDIPFFVPVKWIKHGKYNALISMNIRNLGKQIISFDFVINLFHYDDQSKSIFLHKTSDYSFILYQKNLVYLKGLIHHIDPKRIVAYLLERKLTPMVIYSQSDLFSDEELSSIVKENGEVLFYLIMNFIPDGHRTGQKVWEGFRKKIGLSDASTRTKVSNAAGPELEHSL